MSWKSRRARLMSAGLCVDCGRVPRSETAQRCNKCTAKVVARNRPGMAIRRRSPNYSTADEGMTFTEIGKAMGISRSRAEQICCRALFKLQRACKRAGIDASDIVGKGVSNFASLEKWA